jgi:cardiolipin synthase (CMP-forming)
VTEGEAWAEQLLRELGSRRYRPRAWTRFLATSFARARAVRQERRREHHQALLVGAVGLTAWLAVAPFRPWLALAGVLWSLLVTAMLDWHLGMLEDNDGRPLHRLGLPNLLTLVRAATLPALPVVPPALLAMLLVPVGITDAIDGPIARRRGEETRLGAWLDGTVDTLVRSAAAAGAARHGLLPWWAAALVAGRYALSWLAVSLAYVLRAAPPSRRGLFSGKAAGLVLYSGLALAVLHLPGASALVAVGAAGGLATFALIDHRDRLPDRAHGRRRSRRGRRGSRGHAPALRNPCRPASVNPEVTR